MIKKASVEELIKALKAIETKYVNIETNETKNEVKFLAYKEENEEPDTNYNINELL